MLFDNSCMQHNMLVVQLVTHKLASCQNADVDSPLNLSCSFVRFTDDHWKKISHALDKTSLQ